MKKSVVRPNTSFDLFVNLNNIRTFLTCPEPLRSLMKFSVFGKRPARLTFRLIKSLRINYSFAFWFIVAFVNKNGTVILNLIVIG